MDVIQMARDLGVELQKSETYANYLVAREAAEKDDELQTLVREFNLQKVALTTARQIEDADSENVKAIGARMREVYSQIMQPIISAGDTVGSVLLLGKSERDVMGESEKMLIRTASGFLGRQMEQ